MMRGGFTLALSVFCCSAAASSPPTRDWLTLVPCLNASTVRVEDMAHQQWIFDNASLPARYFTLRNVLSAETSCATPSYNNLSTGVCIYNEECDVELPSSVWELSNPSDDLLGGSFSTYSRVSLGLPLGWWLTLTPEQVTTTSPCGCDCGAAAAGVTNSNTNNGSSLMFRFKLRPPAKNSTRQLFDFTVASKQLHSIMFKGMCVARTL